MADFGILRTSAKCPKLASKPAALMAKCPIALPLRGATAAVEGIIAYRKGTPSVKALREYFAALKKQRQGFQTPALRPRSHEACFITPR